MAKQRSPILDICKTVLVAHHIGYCRVYTTAYKTGGYRAKFYAFGGVSGHGLPRSLSRLRNQLRDQLLQAGFTDVTVVKHRTSRDSILVHAK